MVATLGTLMRLPSLLLPLLAAGCQPPNGDKDSSTTCAAELFADEDGDGYGDSANTRTGCDESDGWVSAGGDCNDADKKIHPGAPELCDGLDNDCEGTTDEGAADASNWYPDLDGDTFGAGEPTRSCDGPDGLVDNDGDCDDTDALIFPGAEEVCDGDDNNCNGTPDDEASDTTPWYADTDGDGYGAGEAVLACNAPEGTVATADDCDDMNADVSPGATEHCDGIDNDCDGDADNGLASLYVDADGDGVGGSDPATCESGGIESTGDCDDGDADVYPGAPELCDGRDNACTSGWVASDEDGTVTLYDEATATWADGTATWSAGTAATPAEITLPDATRVNVCAGTWYVRLLAGGDTDLVSVSGDNAAILDSAGAGEVLRWSEGDSSGLTLDGFTLTATGSRAITLGSGTLSGASLTFMNGTISGAGAADAVGGAIYAGAGTSLTVTSSVLDDNVADLGGAIAGEGATILVSASELENNAAAEGGAVYAADADGVADGFLELHDSTLSNNVATGDGGAVSATVSTIHLLYGNYLANTAGGDGGGVCVRQASTTTPLSFTMDSSTFDTNTAGGEGGATYVAAAAADADLYFTWVTYQFSTAEGGAGGGIYASMPEGGAFSVDMSAFFENEATTSGGAVRVDYGGSASIVSMANSFSTNALGVDGGEGGGAVAISGDSGAGDVSFELVDFTDNDGGGAASGGALLVRDAGTLTLKDTTFTSNTGVDDGGGFAAYNMETVASYVTLTDNTALLDGGHIVVDGGALSLDQSWVSGGSATQGGGLYAASADVTLSGLFSSFIGVSAESGGGVYLAGSSTLDADGWSFTDCVATADAGGGLYVGGSVVAAVRNGAFETSSAATYGGGAYVDGGTLTVADSRFSANIATLGGAAAAIRDGTFSVTDVDFGEPGTPDDNLVGGADGDDVYVFGVGPYAEGDGATFVCTTGGCG